MHDYTNYHQKYSSRYIKNTHKLIQYYINIGWKGNTALESQDVIKIMAENSAVCLHHFLQYFTHFRFKFSFRCDQPYTRPIAVSYAVS